jgi:hypothetical protein
MGKGLLGFEIWSVVRSQWNRTYRSNRSYPPDYPEILTLNSLSGRLLTVGCSWPGHELLAQPRLPSLPVDHPA